jgi:hypothetical protein
MLICVAADASCESGSGETLTREPASEADTFNREGVQRGETLGSTNLLLDALGRPFEEAGSAPARGERSASQMAAPATSSASAAPASARRAGVRRALTP